ncbi:MULTISPECIES: SprT family protein [Brevibacillus]|jgi:SprT-like protein|uniref:Protein SprT-like n=1 Tax=Brevibacillus parabrevis TaxID=54914 RepID=A0A4Y3PRA9_BREPA|nr:MULTISPECIES: SprT family protein [Brevibacillus]MBU8715654.1 SprT family protein [Brevibacillus parabrevis]MDR5001767.1 SprT family protein [Brevibacillus parabrevis]MED2258047.1 SprT family protein [Brevibacillus parabrevis]NRQ56872.1 SprT family protein [Brevibacillus sp. HD1.4A]RNB92086.1 SprT family protein [Brevibacillus parabrevis]
MTDTELQELVEQISTQFFAKPFRHRARFNSRLRTTGGRYLLRSHDIELNPKHLAEHGEGELIAIIKHELCHYHLHLEKKGYRHIDQDFRRLLAQVGGSRYCQQVGSGRAVMPYRYELACHSCGMTYKRKRRMDPSRYRCGRCRGTLQLRELK